MTSGSLVIHFTKQGASPALIFHNKRQGHWRIEGVNRTWSEAKMVYIAEASLYYFPEIERR